MGTIIVVISLGAGRAAAHGFEWHTLNLKTKTNSLFLILNSDSDD